MLARFVRARSVTILAGLVLLSFNRHSPKLCSYDCVDSCILHRIVDSFSNGLLELIELTMHHLERSDLTYITQLENRFERWAVGISRIYPPIENRPVNACHLGKP